MSRYDQEKTNVAEKQYIGPPPTAISYYGVAGSNSNPCPAPLSDSEILAQLFAYHPPTPEQLPKYAAINQAAEHATAHATKTRGNERTVSVH